MAGDAAIRAAILARLDAVTNIGATNDYRRAVTTWTALEAAYTATIGGVKQVRGWSIAWESGQFTPGAWLTSAQMRVAGPQTYVVRGYMSSSDVDATDKTFALLLEDVAEALVTCMAALDPRQSHVPVVLRQNGYAQFEIPGVGIGLVHYGELSVTVHDERAV